jgi:hypothetical protein
MPPGLTYTKAMLKKSIYILLFSVPILAFVDITSNGAPASTTGAPSEPSCTKIGCHQDFVANTGIGTSDLIIGNRNTTYVPGQTYSITAQVTQQGLKRFGFQVVALADRDSTNAGSFQVIESSRTQIIPGAGVFSQRKYMTYTFAGSAAPLQGENQWTFNWTAPSSDIGPVTLYLAGIAANDDGTDMGDYCYLKSFKLNSSPAGVIEMHSGMELKTFPNPVSDQFSVSCYMKKEAALSLDLYSITGQKMECLFSTPQFSGTFSRTFTLSHKYPEGVYFLRVTAGDKTTIQKLFVNP